MGATSGTRHGVYPASGIPAGGAGWGGPARGPGRGGARRVLTGYMPRTGRSTARRERQDEREERLIETLEGIVARCLEAMDRAETAAEMASLTNALSGAAYRACVLLVGLPPPRVIDPDPDPVAAMTDDELREELARLTAEAEGPGRAGP